jgi:hypothetical protein
MLQLWCLSYKNTQITVTRTDRSHTQQFLHTHSGVVWLEKEVQGAGRVQVDICL